MNSANRYNHTQASPEAMRADLLPVPGQVVALPTKERAG